MKKTILLILSFGIFIMFWTPAMAKKESGNLPAPEIINAETYPDRLCVSWEPIEGATKYSLEIEVDVDVDGNSNTDKVVEFSFGTGDRVDGLEPSDSNLCVPLSDFVFDLNGDGILEQISGIALIKVKALNPGKNKRSDKNDISTKDHNPGKNDGRQNNAFSAGDYYTQVGLNTPQDPPFCDPVFPECNDNL